MSSKALTDKIIRTATEEAEQITADAIKRAAESEKIILAKAEAECAKIKAQADEKAALTTRTAKLMSGLDARKEILHAKREVINEAYNEALRRVLTLPDAQKLAYIKSLIIKYAPEAEFTVTVSAGDAHLLTDGVIAELEASLKEKFGNVKIIKGVPSDSFCGGVYMTGIYTDADATCETIFNELKETYESDTAAILF